MIVWNEQESDFHHKPIAELLPTLAFTVACAVMLGGESLPRVIVRRHVIEAVWNHLREQRVEMGGLLIGAVHDIDHGGSDFVVSVEDFARGDKFDGTGVSLRLDTGVWEGARAKLDGERTVIGWYHSHPNLGAYFSGTDRRTQKSFFNHPHCLGLVIDPVRREEKWFMGGDSETMAQPQVLRVD